jgi:hypothetical protein
MSRKNVEEPDDRMKHRYADYAEHPRFGKYPRVTGLNPESDFTTGKPFLHWNAAERIPNTAVEADLSRQSRATVPVTHYYDVKRKCRDCGRPFIFFAEEQKHWYEELGLPLEADCVRCVPCRKRQHGIAAKRERYEELFHRVERTADENLEMAECCVSLIEEGVFNARQAQHVRRLLKQAEARGGAAEACDDLRTRLAALDP